MSAPLRRSVLLLLPLALLLTGLRPAAAQSGDVTGQRRYYPQSGHWVGGEFLKTYLSVADPARVYGYPITEAYQEAQQGRIVQYFERARFELSPQSPPELRVAVTQLGYLMYIPGPQISASNSPASCREFAESGKRVCYAFLAFFDANGGAAQFGYPLSNFELHDERIVQYFQKARFEWHPELPPGQKVALTKLGSRYFDFIGEDPALLLAAPWVVPGSDLPQPVLDLQMRAFPQSAVLPQTARQTIFVIVQDQNLLPVSHAQVTLVIRLPSGKEARIILPELTDANGIARYSFDFAAQPVGSAEVRAEAFYEGLRQQTVTSFRIWW
ncbi:MAG: carboxypeptidase-like regulatory domain-containing protein [Chloroflexi bacterium]|nr:carboxypeptidase-like regulatory domain-containing protein [Chloroflexota bacterium]